MHLCKKCNHGKKTFYFMVVGMLSVFSSSAQFIGNRLVQTDTGKIDTAKLRSLDKVDLNDSIDYQEENGLSSDLNKRVYLWNRTLRNRYNVNFSSTVYSKDVQSTPVRDISNIIAGRLTGLYTLQSSGKTGSDGSTFSVRGRTPLFVIDGVVRPFTNFNANEVKSVTVLKDANATAMWGLRGANGVILVETKTESSKNFELNASIQQGISSPVIRPKFLGAADYATLYNEAQLNDNPSAEKYFSDSLITQYRSGMNNPYLSPNVDWYNTVLKRNTDFTRLSLDVSGTGKSYRYFAAIEKYGQTGNFITDKSNLYNTNNDYHRYNIRLNASVDFNQDITLGINMFGSLVNANQPGVSTSTIMSRIYTTPPTAYPIINMDSSYAGTNIWKTNIYASTVNSGYLYDRQITVSSDVNLRYNLGKIVKGLWAKAAFSVNSYYFSEIDRSKSFAVYQYDQSTGDYTKYNSDGYVEEGSEAISNQYDQTYYNFMLGYDKRWNDSKLNLLATYNIDNSTYDSDLEKLNTVYKVLGLNVNYSYLDKYLVNMTTSYSGMNYYPKNKQWGAFPSLSLGWIISNEKNFKSKIINFLKLKSSFGLAAWGDPGYFSWLQGYTTGSTGYNIGSTATAVSGSYENTLANPDITWEKSLKWDIGVQSELLDNKFGVEINYYFNHNYDQLIDAGDKTAILGNSYPELNDGKTNYYGFEGALRYSILKKNWNFNIEGNISFANSKVLNLNEGSYPYSWMYLKGLPQNQTTGYIAEGFYSANDDFENTAHIVGYTPQAGDIKYKDLNNDGVINYLDKTAIGNKKALIFYGVNIRFSYKDFDISALVQGVSNRLIYLSPTSSAIQAFSSSYGTVQSFHLDRWTASNTSNVLYPRLSLGTNLNNSQSSTFWMKNGNYLRLKNVELGYSLPKTFIKAMHLTQVRFFMNAYNLFTLSKVKDYNIDPESQTSVFPVQRIINGGISIKL